MQADDPLAGDPRKPQQRRGRGHREGIQPTQGSPWAVKTVTAEDPWSFLGIGRQMQSLWVEHTLYPAQQAPPQAEGQHNLAPLPSTCCSSLVWDWFPPEVNPETRKAQGAMWEVRPGSPGSEAGQGPGG